MKRQKLTAEYDRLKYQIINLKSSTRDTQIELISLSCQSVCVSICGSLEQCLKEIFVEYAKRKSGNKLNGAIERLRKNYQNPKTVRILELVSLFDKDFGRELERAWSEEKEIEKSHLDNLVNDRNIIAHRTRTHFSVTTSKLDDYHRAYTGLLNRVYDHFLGGGSL